MKARLKQFHRHSHLIFDIGSHPGMRSFEALCADSVGGVAMGVVGFLAG